MKRSPKVKPSEAGVAAVLTAWLRAESWSVYEEVSSADGDSCDIVATRGGVISAIEVKLGLNLTVLGQARRWVGQSNLTWVAVPTPVRGNNLEGARWVCEALGLGLYNIGPLYVTELCRPTYMRVNTASLRKRLQPEQQDGTIPAGSAGVSRYTPFRLTVLDLEKIVAEFPGITLKLALTKMKRKHHYSSDKAAIASLSKYIRKGVIKTIEVSGRNLALRLIKK